MERSSAPLKLIPAPKIEVFGSIVKYICVIPESEHFTSLVQLRNMLEMGAEKAHILQVLNNTILRGGQIKFENPK